jgi:hypothetical protein
MDPCREKRTKHQQDAARTSKRGCSGKAPMTHGPPPLPHHHPSHSSEKEEDDREMFKRHAPIERSSHLAIKYSKKTKQGTINVNREALVYEGSKQSHDPRFCSLFHSDWYRSIYLHKVRAVVETQWVNWDWMTTRRHSVFNKIKATCDELEMTEMMCFNYDWNKEIIYQFYATLYFDADGQRLLWMTYGQRCEITLHEFARMLGLEHQLSMETKARIHSFDMLKLDEMQFMYALGALAHPPKIQNFLL